MKEKKREKNVGNQSQEQHQIKLARRRRILIMHMCSYGM
jgi:hypothetical protein